MRKQLRATMVVVVALSITHSAAYAVVSMPSPKFSVASFGAKGDGVTNDAPALQKAIDAANAAGGGTVVFPKATYLVRRTGSFGGQPYCLLLKDNVALDLGGSTIRLDRRQNSAILLNKGFPVTGPPTVNVTISNGVFDLDRTYQSSLTDGTMAAVFIQNAKQVTLNNLRIDNARDTAVRLIKIDYLFADNLHSTWSDGDAFALGTYLPGGSYDGRIRNATIGKLIADNCQHEVYGVLQGNPVTVNAVDSSIAEMVANSCGGGFKVQDGSQNVHIGSAIFYGATGANRTATNASDNSGMKVQGDFAGYGPKNITIDNVFSSGAAGTGLYLHNVTDVTVGTFVGNGNATNASYPDVWIGQSTRAMVSNIDTSGAGTTAVTIRADAMDYTVNRVVVRNAGKVVTGAIGVAVNGGRGRIGTALIQDTQTSPTTRRGMYVASSAAGNLDFIAGSGMSSDLISNTSTSFVVRYISKLSPLMPSQPSQITTYSTTTNGLVGDVAPVGAGGILTSDDNTRYGDGKIDLRDAIHLLRVASGMATLP